MGPAPHDYHIFSGYVSELPYGMYRNSQWLYHGSLFKTHVVRQRQHKFCRRYKVLGGHARRLKAHDLQFLTQVIFTVSAWITFPAGHLRLYGDFLSGLQPRYAWAGLYNFSRYLMPLSYRITGEGMLSMIYVYVGATYTDVSHLDQDFTLTRFSDGHFSKLYFAGFGHNLL